MPPPFIWYETDFLDFFLIYFILFFIFFIVIIYLFIFLEKSVSYS